MIRDSIMAMDARLDLLLNQLNGTPHCCGLDTLS